MPRLLILASGISPLAIVRPEGIEPPRKASEASALSAELRSYGASPRYRTRFTHLQGELSAEREARSARIY